ncbi:hypothetical protein [Catellatospora chokoriensis]|uniref:Uncharacterized protein n=1 Tax=Catellatospora chokoriensis TaxID=310353 RepID=A0A8J3K538_9ACTN|nr:hypothetical protein [Catellatospora chokoriensis]GIF90438.1 hypothetical protein Cch02nite_38820 [Catellatospora chokoriensis]
MTGTGYDVDPRDLRAADRDIRDAVGDITAAWTPLRPAIGVPDDDTTTAEAAVWCAGALDRQINGLVAQSLDFAQRLDRAAFEY